MRKITIIAMVIAIAIIFLFTACTAQSGENIIFGTFYNIKINGASSRSTIKNIEKLFVEIENQVSTAIETSDVYKINHAPLEEPVIIGEHTRYLFEKSLELYHSTEKSFNAAIFPLVELWNFSPDTFAYAVESIPNDEAISTTLEYSKMENFLYNKENSTITRLNENAKLDFGGIAKGYAVDKAIELSSGKKDALINIGGNISTIGKEKRIGLTHPRVSSKLFGVIKLDGKAIATSGDYERYYTFNDIRYSHIIGLDGYPINISSDIISVAVIGESAMICDALSTAVMVLGEAWAKENLQNMGYSAIIITNGNYAIVGDIDFENLSSYIKK